MLSEAELVAALRKSAIARYCRAIDVLPNLSEKSLAAALKNPPAVYVSVAKYEEAGDEATERFSLWVVAQNFRGHQAARQGDGIVMGLYDLADAVMATVRATTGYVVSGFIPDKGEYADAYGVHTGEITCSVKTDLGNEIDLAERLSPFQTFHADYDIDPTTPGAYAGWLLDPPSTAQGSPDASDTQTLPQEP